MRRHAQPSTRKRLTKRSAVLAVAVCAAVVALVPAGSIYAAETTGADVVLVDLSVERAAVGTPYTYAYEIDNWGPDSVTAVLKLEQVAITRLAGLYDTVADPVVLNRIGSAMDVALTMRDRMLNAVIALNPEGAGLAYADGMADSVDGYTDEVANLTEALKVDRLTTSARSALANALSRSQAAAAKVTAAFGGGE